jgi:hypothetical protein
MYEWISDLKALEDSSNHHGVQTGPEDEQQGILERVISPIMHSLCSDRITYIFFLHVLEVFYYAKRHLWTLKPCCVRALKQIFILFYSDKDGALVLSVMWSLMISSFFSMKATSLSMFSRSTHSYLITHIILSVVILLLHSSHVLVLLSSLLKFQAWRQLPQKNASRREWKRLTVKHYYVNLCPCHISHHLCSFWW